MPLPMLRAVHPRLLYPHSSACFCFWVLCVGRPPSVLPATQQYPLPCPVLLLAAGLGNKSDVPSTAEGWHIARADELLLAMLPEGQELGMWQCLLPCDCRVVSDKTPECAGAWSLRGCVTAEMQGRADPRPLCSSCVAEDGRDHPAR